MPNVPNDSNWDSNVSEEDKEAAREADRVEEEKIAQNDDRDYQEFVKEHEGK